VNEYDQAGSPNIIQIRGVVIPSWLVVCLLLTAVLSALSLLLVWQSQTRIERELRILQVHCADIENVLIRSGVAVREDFVSRHENQSETSSKTQGRQEQTP
jgi:hypothetical protein